MTNEILDKLRHAAMPNIYTKYALIFKEELQTLLDERDDLVAATEDYSEI